VETENDGKQMNYVFVFCPKLYIMKQEKYFQFHFNIMLVVLHDQLDKKKIWVEILLNMN